MAAGTGVAIRVQNIYGDFLRSFKVFLDRVTRNTLNKIEWNYGAKTLEYYYMMDGGDGHGHESFEFPVALINIDDIQPVDNVGPIARNAGMNVNHSPHQLVIAENLSRDERIILDKRWVTMMTTITINVEDVSSLLNYYDLFIGYMPMQYFFYDYYFYTYIEVTPFCEHWNFDTDDIMNLSIKPPDHKPPVEAYKPTGSEKDEPMDPNINQQMDATFKYEPDVHYSEADPDPHFKTETRERDLGRDQDTVREGYRYFATVKMEPILKLQSIQKQTDKETMKHSLVLNFEMQIEIPNLLIGNIDYYIKTIELVIDPTCSIGRSLEYPLLTDMDDKLLINKNISGGVILQDEDFHLFDPNDPKAGPSYLEINADININRFNVALWAVEDVTIAQASRHFIPLNHAKVIRNVDENGNFVSLHFVFEELNWFRTFDFDNSFNYLKLILFEEGAVESKCSGKQS